MGNTLLTEPEEIAEALADHYQSVSSNLSYTTSFLETKSKIESRPLRYPELENEPYNQAFTLQELFHVLDSVKGSSPGPDRIHYEMLRRLPFYAKRSLLTVFNEIWTGDEFPQEWRQSLLIPILKPGKDPKIPASHRPIMLTSCLCKTMERMVNRRLAATLETRKLLDPRPYGFRKGKSINSHLTNLEGTLKFSIDKKTTPKYWLWIFRRPTTSPGDG